LYPQHDLERLGDVRDSPSEARGGTAPPLKNLARQRVRAYQEAVDRLLLPMQARHLLATLLQHRPRVVVELWQWQVMPAMDHSY